MLTALFVLSLKLLPLLFFISLSSRVSRLTRQTINISITERPFSIHLDQSSVQMRTAPSDAEAASTSFSSSSSSSTSSFPMPSSIAPGSAVALAASRRLRAINRHVAVSQCSALEKTPRDAEEMV